MSNHDRIELDALQNRIESEDALLLLFGTPTCRSCHALKPKLWGLIDQHFPKIGKLYVDAEASPEAAAQLGVFAVPMTVVFFGGRETLRQGRHGSIGQLGGQLQRPYGLFFD